MERRSPEHLCVEALARAVHVRRLPRGEVEAARSVPYPFAGRTGAEAAPGARRHPAGRLLRLPDHLERRPRRRAVHTGEPAGAASVSGMPEKVTRSTNDAPAWRDAENRFARR